ncbi:hypothetical protein BS17DRAFT_771090 [Gyrodon lividus]|nr:hypothetical protein BS17DRAFT_771090 [Gyrodon lividus]
MVINLTSISLGSSVLSCIPCSVATDIIRTLPRRLVKQCMSSSPRQECRRRFPPCACVRYISISEPPFPYDAKCHFQERRSQFPHPQAGLEKVIHLEILDPASVDNFAVTTHLFKSLKFLALPIHHSPEFVPVNLLKWCTLGHLEELQLSVEANNIWDNGILKVVADSRPCVVSPLFRKVSAPKSCLHAKIARLVR